MTKRFVRDAAAAKSSRTAYAYRAAHLDGRLEAGVVDAANSEAAVSQLVARGLYPIEVAARGATRNRLPSLPLADAALGLRMLGDLLAAGLPMARALAAFEQLAPPRWSAALPAIRECIRDGGTLASALATAPVGIPSIAVGIISIGDAAGGTANAVREAADVLSETHALRLAIRNALAYPMTLAVAGTASVGVMVAVVLPRFESILRDLGQSLPPATRMLVSSAALVRTAAPAALVLLALIVLLLRSWITTPKGAERWDELLLNVPVVGGLRASAATARSCAALAALLKSGVPIAPALQQAAAAAGDAAIELRILAARAATIQGKRLSTALADHSAVSATAVRLVRTGEETGDLTSMLGHAARLERERTGSLMRAAVRLLEPAIILLFGGLIAFVAGALLQAVYSIRPVP
jgi:general secretion pathway protein F